MPERRSYLPRRTEQAVGEPWFEDAFMGEHMPALYELLARSEEGGKARQGATLSLYGEQGRLKVCINDRHTGMLWFATLGTAEALLETLNTMLVEGRGEWRKGKG